MAAPLCRRRRRERTILDVNRRKISFSPIASNKLIELLQALTFSGCLGAGKGGWRALKRRFSPHFN